MSLKAKKIIKRTLIVLIFLSGGIGYWQYKKSSTKSDIEYIAAKVERGNLKQTVSATGTIKPLAQVELNFKAPDKIAYIKVKKGDKVKEGDILVAQDDNNLKISVQQAQANLDSSIALLEKIKAGATKEDIDVSRKSVDAAQIAYDNAVKNLESIRKKTVEDIIASEKNVNASQTILGDKKTNLNDTKNTYFQSVKNKESSAITDISSSVFTAVSALDTVSKSLSNNDTISSEQRVNNISQKNSVYLTSAQGAYFEANNAVDDMEKMVDDLEKNINSEISDVLNSSISALNKVKNAFSFTYSALQNTVSSSSYSQTNIDANKSAISSSKISVETIISLLQSDQQKLIDAKLAYDNQVNAAQAAVNAAQDNLNTAKANLSAAGANKDLQISSAEADVDAKLGALNLVKSQLNLKEAPPRPVDLASQEPQVAQYRAALALAQDNFGNAILKSAIAGTITDVNYEAGEQSLATKPVIVLVSEGDYEIEVDVSEADIAQVKIGNNSSVTFDSLGEESVFKAKVIFIDPAQTVISDVVYYKVKIVLESDGNNGFDKIKSGMTANVDILTDYKENVLMMPQRASHSRNGKKYAQILEKKADKQNIIDVEIETGINGDDGLVEVISGLNEGQEVVTFIKNGNKL